MQGVAETLGSGRQGWYGLEVTGKGNEKTLFKTLFPTKRPWAFWPSVSWCADGAEDAGPPLLSPAARAAELSER